MEPYLYTQDLSVGYDGKVLIHDINIAVERGKILTLIGPNGAGKSTILKSITRHLAKLRGTVYIGGKEIYSWRPKEMAQQVAVVLTDRIRPELMTCGEVVAMGRYPYTNALGKLTDRDKVAVRRALEQVHALELEDRDFTALSDGQRQRIMLARAICQEPEVIVLDEPTAFLDIRHKIELLDILRAMAQEAHTTVVMSLHEIDLAAKISDYLICVKGDTIAKFGPPDEIFGHGDIDRLYDIENGSYNMLFGSVELGRPQGEPRVFVVGGGGYGACKSGRSPLPPVSSLRTTWTIRWPGSSAATWCPHRPSSRWRRRSSWKRRRCCAGAGPWWTRGRLWAPSTGAMAACFGWRRRRASPSTTGDTGSEKMLRSTRRSDHAGKL